MSGINKVILVGHLGKDADFRNLPDGVAILSFPLATTDHVTRNGVKEEQTEWHNVVMWRGLAETAYKVLKKGRLVYMEGKIHTRSFTDKAGINRYITEVIADKFVLLGRASDFEEVAFNSETL